MSTNDLDPRHWDERTKYEYARWTQRMDKLCALNLIASDGSAIEWHGTPLKDLDSETLHSVFDLVCYPQADGFAHIGQAYRDAQKAIACEFKRRGVSVHPSVRVVSQ